MARINKNPEERKAEIIAAAHQLFIENGYAKTMVSDIVRKVGIAQGTFYYYFPTKEYVLGAIIDILLKAEDDRFAQFIAEGGTALEAFTESLDRTLGVWLTDPDTFPLAFVFAERDFHLIDRLKRQYVVQPVRRLAALLEQGVREHSMRVEYCHEAAVAIAETMYALLAEPVLSGCDREQLRRRAVIAEQILSRVLGLSSGEIRIARWFE